MCYRIGMAYGYGAAPNFVPFALCGLTFVGLGVWRLRARRDSQIAKGLSDIHGALLIVVGIVLIIDSILAR